MDISILNLSDIPAKISNQEYETGIEELREMWYSIRDYLSENEDIDRNVSTFNNILSSDENSCILFSSWWNSAINYIKKINTNDIKWTNILLWFSDILHIFSVFDKVENVFCLYGPTLRNIWDLSINEKKNLNSFISNQALEFEIQQVMWWDEYHCKIFGGHALIFSQLFEYFNFEMEWGLLFLEFHWMEEYLIKYILNVLNLKWVFSKIKWVILNQWVEPWIIENLKSLDMHSIYLLNDVSLIPLYKDVTISWWKLLMGNSV